MKRNHYWAVEYVGGNKNCTRGESNPVTGNFSLAVNAHCFQTKLERDEWVGRKHLREAVDKKKLRSMLLGMTPAAFKDHCNWLIDSAYLI